MPREGSNAVFLILCVAQKPIAIFLIGAPFGVIICVTIVFYIHVDFFVYWVNMNIPRLVISKI